VTAIVVGARSAAEITTDVGYLTTGVPAELFRELAAAGLVPDESPGQGPSGPFPGAKVTG
jgi:hypothetical protein